MSLVIWIVTFFQYWQSVEGFVNPACGTRVCNVSDISAKYSLHSCVGQTNTLRSCKFRNLYFSVKEREWVYFQCGEDPFRAKIEGLISSSTNFSTDSSLPADLYYMQRDFIDWGNRHYRRDYKVTPIVRTESPPESSTVHDVNGVSVIWDFTTQSGFSFGHCLLNEWLPMFLTITTHTYQMPNHFRVLSHNSTHDMYTVSPVHLCLQYMSAWSGSLSTHFDLVLNEIDRSGYSWIRFCDLIVGDSGHAKEADTLVFETRDHPRTRSSFNTVNWRNFRISIYSALNLPVPSVVNSHEGLQQSIIIVSKPKDEQGGCMVGTHLDHCCR